jgi:C1A family cysteine protease
MDYSRLFIYYNSRRAKNVDSGAQMRDVFKSMETFGACDEKIWPYNIRKFKRKPSNKAYLQGEKFQAIQYSRIQQTRSGLKQVLAEGFPVCFGFTVTNSFHRTGKDGIVSKPKGSARGGHAVLLVGYKKGHYIVRNSWGTKFGDNGYCYFPYKFLEDPGFAADFWTVRAVENGRADGAPTSRDIKS